MSNFLIKSYLKEHLNEPIEYVRWRMNLISEITNNEVFFKEVGNEIKRYSRKYKMNTLKTNLTNQQAFNLAKQLDLAYSKNISHGDIHKKNILADGGLIKLIDWEPCLKQNKHNQNTLMVTYPWIDPIDRINKEVTLNTDILCFYRLICPKRAYFFDTDEWGDLREIIFDSKIPFTKLTYILFKENLYE